MTEPNIAIMQYNLRALNHANAAPRPAFCYPGFEPQHPEGLMLSHDVNEVLNVAQMAHSIDATGRIMAAETLEPKRKLADLEHHEIHKALANEHKTGATVLPTWCSEAWFLSALPQRLNRFRESAANIQLYVSLKNGHLRWWERNQDGELVSRNQAYTIHTEVFSDEVAQRFWLKRDYQTCLQAQLPPEASQEDEAAWFKVAQRYGEIMLPDYIQGKEWVYSDQLGLSTAIDKEGEVE